MRQFKLAPGITRFETGLGDGLLVIEGSEIFETDDPTAIGALANVPHAVVEVGAKAEPDAGEPDESDAEAPAELQSPSWRGSRT
jgi:hypothetical protein